MGRATDLPREVLEWVVDYVENPFALAATDRCLRAVVRRSVLQWDSRRPGATEWMLARRPALVWLEGVRFDTVPAWVASVVGTTTVLVITVHDWTERRTLARFLMGLPVLSSLSIRAAATPVLPGHLTDVIVGALARPEVRRITVGAARMGLRDESAAAIAHAIAVAPSLERCELDLSLNRLSARGLEALVTGLIAAPALRDVTLDLGGNWIRGAGYGAVVARLGDIPGLRSLDIRFGGWGMRKQYGMEHLARLGDARGLVSLGLTIRGAQITVDSFKRVAAGIARLPALRALMLDFTATTTVGPQCHRAFALLAGCPGLRRLSVRLYAPSAAILRGLTAMGVPDGGGGGLSTLELVLEQPNMWFDTEHAAAVLALINAPRIRVHLVVRSARFEPGAWDRLHTAAESPRARLTLDVHRRDA